MESKTGSQENIKSRLRIQPSRRAKNKDINNDDKENLSNQHETKHSKVVTQKIKKDVETEPVMDKTLKDTGSKSNKMKKEKIIKGESNLVNSIGVILLIECNYLNDMDVFSKLY